MDATALANPAPIPINASLGMDLSFCERALLGDGIGHEPQVARAFNGFG